MADYRNAQDQDNAKNFGFGQTLDQANSLADFLKQKQQFKQQLDNPIRVKQAESQIAQQTQQSNLDKIKGLMANRKPGEKTMYDLDANGGVKTSEMPPNMMMLMGGHLGQEGQRIAGLAGKAFKPIQDQAEAAEATLRSLDQGTAAADKAAIINEANMFLKGGGGRAMSAVMAQLTGEPSAQGQLQKAQNWINNTANIPTLQPAQRNSLREAVLGRIPMLIQQHQQVSNTLPAQARSMAPFTASQGGLNDLIDSYGSGAKQSLDRLNGMAQQYNQQKQQAQAPVSDPATFNQQPSTMDKLKGLFHLGSKQPAQQPPAQQGMSPGAGQRSVMKTEVSPSTGKKRITYSDGSQEIQ